MLVLAGDDTQPPGLGKLRNFLIDQGVARFMLPDTLAFIDKLPMTAVGKVARQQLIATVLQSRQNPETPELPATQGLLTP